MIPAGRPPLSPLEERLLKYLRSAMNDGVIWDEELADEVPVELHDPQRVPYLALERALGNLERLGLVRKLECWQHVRDPEATS